MESKNPSPQLLDALAQRNSNLPALPKGAFGAATENAHRPVTWSDLGKCCGTSCDCYGRGYVTYVQQGQRVRRPW